MRSNWLYWLMLSMIAGESLVPSRACVAATNAFILNEANSVSGDKFIDKGRSDPFLNRVEGHGQNWFEFLVVAGNDLPGGGHGNTLDLRGWSLDWSYDKQDIPVGEDAQSGFGTITFTDDPLWSAVPRGTLLTVSEWRQAWYKTDTSFFFDPWGAGGLERAGGINGLGNVRNAPFNPNPAVHTLLDLSTDATWNPLDTSETPDGDWHMHVWAGERNPDDSFKYFEFSGEVTVGGETDAIGTDEAGLFAINNDGWQWTIKNADGVTTQGPFGEDESADGGGNWGTNPTEIIKLEAFDASQSPTAASYMNTNVNHYRDGSTGSFGESNSWSSGGGFQDLRDLRDWVVPGDADLDGVVTGNDFLTWQRGVGATEGADLRQGDLNGDGAVDGDDLADWALHFGGPAASASTAPLPEPRSLAMVAAACLAVFFRRRFQFPLPSRERLVLQR